MAFKHCISFATYLAAYFGCNDAINLKSYQTLFQSFCAQPSEVAVLSVLFDYQTPFPRTGCISFATNFATNFGCNWFRIMPDIVSKLLRAAIWSCCAVLFESEQTPFPRTGRQLTSAALHRIWFRTAVLFLCHIFTQWRMHDCKIEQSNGRCFDLQELLINSIENFISH